MAHRFYTEQSLAIGPAQVDGDDAHHIANVRRLTPGEKVILFNGDGHDYFATIVRVTKKSVDVLIESIESTTLEARRPIVIATAFPKGDRFDFLLEKLVELGVTKLIPLITTRSVVIPSESKRDKWQRAVIEASKQCGRNRLMEIDVPVPWEKYCLLAQGARWIAHPGSSESNSPFTGMDPVQIAIGPEGGFSDPEVDLAIQSGWQPISFGRTILRVETAAIAAAVLASLK
jgi:16S rRNA (uracil1498-N3)-methyltransferase